MKRTSILLAVIFAAFISISNAQDEGGIKFKATADLVSNYIWRGMETKVAHFQPTAAIVMGNLEIGAWGSTDITGSYKEVDMYASFTAGAFNVQLWDYNWGFNRSFFNYKSEETDHIVELCLNYTLPEAFPMTISVNAFIFGADKKKYSDAKETDLKKQNYSNYIALSYPIKDTKIFTGFSSGDGYYGDDYYWGFDDDDNLTPTGVVGGFAMVNLGLQVTKSLKITDSYSLPIKSVFGFNPQAENAYLAFGITF